MVKRKSSKKAFEEIPFGLISYTIGIIALVEAFLSPFVGIILSIIGIVFSNKENSPISSRGKRLGTIALVVGLILLIVTIFVAYNTSSIFGVPAR